MDAGDMKLTQEQQNSVSQLVELFADVDVHIIIAELRANKFDVSATIEKLLSRSTESASSGKQHSPSPTPSSYSLNNFVMQNYTGTTETNPTNNTGNSGSAHPTQSSGVEIPTNKAIPINLYTSPNASGSPKSASSDAPFDLTKPIKSVFENPHVYTSPNEQIYVPGGGTSHDIVPVSSTSLPAFLSPSNTTTNGNYVATTAPATDGALNRYGSTPLHLSPEVKEFTLPDAPSSTPPMSWGTTAASKFNLDQPSSPYEVARNDSKSNHSMPAADPPAVSPSWKLAPEHPANGSLPSKSGSPLNTVPGVGYFSPSGLSQSRYNDEKTAALKNQLSEMITSLAELDTAAKQDAAEKDEIIAQIQGELLQSRYHLAQVVEKNSKTISQLEADIRTLRAENESLRVKLASAVPVQAANNLSSQFQASLEKSFKSAGEGPTKEAMTIFLQQLHTNFANALLATMPNKDG